MSMLSALNDRLMLFQSSSWQNRIQLQEDRDFAPPERGYWIAQSMKWNPPAMLGMGVAGQYRVQGNYELELHYPANEGMVAADALARSLAVHFPRGLTLNPGPSCVTVERAFVSSAVGDTLIPVTVEVFGYEPY